MEKISFVGLGKLGLCMASCLAVKGKYKIIGIDNSDYIVNSINKGVSPTLEAKLQKFITEAGPSLRATKNLEEAITQTDTTFIMVNTPNINGGIISNFYIDEALKSLAQFLKKSNKKYHLFVLSSTVMPGSIEGSFIPILEKHSGRKLNDGFGFCYNPELVAIGSVIDNYLNPDLIILGQSIAFDGEFVADIYHKCCENNPPIFQMSFVNAEIAKIALNCYITTKISFVNTLSNLCEKITGADTDVITQAIGADKRISPLYLKGGLGFGGTCFPRDVMAYTALAKKNGIKDDLISAVDKVNKYQDQRLTEMTLSSILSSGQKKASVLGIAFKPGTPIISNSPGMTLINSLIEQGIVVTVYDTLAIENAKTILGDKIRYAVSIQECVSQSPVCVITTPSKEFKQIDDSCIAFEPTTIIDCWRILDPYCFTKSIKYIPWGRGPTKTKASEV